MPANESFPGGRAADVGASPAPDLDLERWRREGRRAGQAFAARLRALESQERAARVIRSLSLPAAEATASSSPARIDSWQIERQLELFHEFHRALSRSRAWRLVQALRRPFGRDW